MNKEKIIDVLKKLIIRFADTLKESDSSVPDKYANYDANQSYLSNFSVVLPNASACPTTFSCMHLDEEVNACNTTLEEQGREEEENVNYAFPVNSPLITLWNLTGYCLDVYEGGSDFDPDYDSDSALTFEINSGNEITAIKLDAIQIMRLRKVLGDWIEYISMP